MTSVGNLCRSGGEKRKVLLVCVRISDLVQAMFQ